MEIDKGIPIPERRKAFSKYPFKEMEIGDSFFIDKKLTTISSVAFQATKKTGYKFSLRTVEEKKKKGTRCWRIK